MATITSLPLIHCASCNDSHIGVIFIFWLHGYSSTAKAPRQVWKTSDSSSQWILRIPFPLSIERRHFRVLGLKELPLPTPKQALYYGRCKKPRPHLPELNFNLCWPNTRPPPSRQAAANNCHCRINLPSFLFYCSTFYSTPLMAIWGILPCHPLLRTLLHESGLAFRALNFVGLFQDT